MLKQATNLVRKFKTYGPSKFFAFALRESWHIIYYNTFLHSFSHDREDLIVEKALGKIPSFYVDVGAFLPKKFNNTYRFYQKGISGINIEPNPKYWRILEDKRPRDINLNCGVADAPGELVFYEIEFGVGSTFDKGVAEKAKEAGYKINREKVIGVQTLEQILDTHAKGKNIDFLSIDTESFDYKVLKSNNWDKYQPKVICIESNLEHSDNRIHEFLNGHGYELFIKTEQNGIYKLRNKS